MPTKSTPSMILEAAKNALRQLQFAPIGKYYLSAPVTHDAFAFLNLSASRNYANLSSGAFLLQASFGLRLESMHRKFCELSGWRDSPDFVAISYCPLLNGVPHQSQHWPVSISSEKSDLEVFVHQIRRNILPALHQVAEPVAICQALLEDKNGAFSWPAIWWNPIAYITLGRNEEALRYAEEHLAATMASSAANESFISNYFAYVERIRSHLRRGQPLS